MARKGLALRGGNSDEDSNFMQTLKLRAKDIRQLTDWMKRKQNKFMSHHIQNEIIRTMVNQITRDKTANIPGTTSIQLHVTSTETYQTKNSYRFAHVGLINFLLQRKNF